MKVKASVLAYFFENMAFMMEVGFSLSGALDSILQNSQGKSSGDKAMHRVAAVLQADVLSGYSLHEAMERHIKIFGNSYPKQVRAGEHSGKLPEILERIGKQIQESASTADRIRTAMIYPAIVLVATVSVSMYLFTAIVPQMMDTIAETGIGEIPALSLIVMGISEFLLQHFLAVVLGTLALAVGVRWLVKYPLRMPCSKYLLKLPAIGLLQSNIDYLMFYRSMQYLLAAGLPMSETLETSIAGVRNVYIKAELTAALHKMMSHGQPLSQIMEPVTTMPRLELQAIAAGEQSGKLTQTFERLVVHKNEHSEQAIKRLIAVLDPALMIIIGAIVGVVVVAIYLPMVSMAF